MLISPLGEMMRAGEELSTNALRRMLVAALGVLAASSLFLSLASADDGAQKELKDTTIAKEAPPPLQLVNPPVPTRARPGEDAVPSVFPPYIFESVPDIRSSASEFVSVPNRWNQFYAGKWYDPYNQNILKGDLPVFGSPGHEWFLELTGISDTAYEHTKLPIPVGGATTRRPGSIDTFGGGNIDAFVEQVFTSISLIRGNTTFKPPDFEFRFSPVFNFNHAHSEENGVLRVDPTNGATRNDNHIGFQELFVDKHLFNLTDRYDFVSLRAGIQQFQTDFRGFIYNDNEPGVRLFGNYDNNRWQYNAAWFYRLNKDINTGLNTVFDARHENVVVANLYRQDVLALGNTIEASIIHREDRAGDYGDFYDPNGALRRPASIGDLRPNNLSTTYFGLANDGHIGRINMTSAFYYVLGSESHNEIAGAQQDIRAGMGAVEFSYDVDWVRFRTSAFYASGDSNPYDRRATGFDAIFDNPNFAGGDLSFWQRQGIPLIGGGGVFLTNHNSLLPDFRASKEVGQSNFVNPGVRLINAGVDFDLTPKVKLVTNASFLQFDKLGPLKAVRHDGSLGRNIGVDLSAGILYRPFLNNNVILRAGSAVLLPGNGLNSLYPDDVLYDVFTNVILEY